MSPLIILLFVLIAAFFYWQLVVAEGAYLGRRVVAWLYDLVATRYNAIKQYTAEDDARFLGMPLALSLQGELDPIVLDVATGTSRLPLVLCQQPFFHGRLIALDNARRMLHEATRYLAEHRERVTWVWQHAVPLPFDGDTFEAVTCLEALEFMPDTRATLAECVRVLKPGGMLLVSNRIATGARLMPGKTHPKAKFESLLMELGQSEVTTQVWQFDYDLVWSLKPDNDTAGCHTTGCHSERSEESLAQPTAPPVWPRDSSSHPSTPASSGSASAQDAPRNNTLVRCPIDRGPLDRVDTAVQCRTCSRRYPIGRDGVIELL
jgi:ubiquinone/menaquinone biosynthesis C-methylase UbiE